MNGLDLPEAAPSTQPVRTCLGCRQVAAKSELLRIVAVDGVLTADPAARLGGRGAYVHRRAECLDKAEQRRAFQRALRLSEPPTGGRELRMSMTTSHDAGANVNGMTDK